MTDNDHGSESPQSSSSSNSSSIASIFASAADGLTTTAHNPDTPTSINSPTNNASDVESLHTCPHRLTHRPGRSFANPLHGGGGGRGKDEEEEEEEEEEERVR
ncbi:hypothetical protein SprV_0902754800 [Sparganum proliferum]